MSTKATVLVVDDEPRVRQELSRFLTLRGYKVECLDSGAAVIPRLTAPETPSLLLLDLMMPQVCGLDILAEMLKLERPVPTIVVSAVGQVSTVVQAIRMGARDYVVKPFEDAALDQAIRTVLDQALPQSNSDADFIWSTEKLRKIRDVAVQIADTNLPVLILGESGVGKDVAARFIHSHSVRRSEPFVSVNCAALPGELLESEFFGYNTGAFTGALRDKPGKFELAGRGTLVLDEIGEMSAHLQAEAFACPARWAVHSARGRRAPTAVARPNPGIDKSKSGDGRSERRVPARPLFPLECDPHRTAASS